MAKGKIRKFSSGATRDTDEGKLDFEGFFSPRVLEALAAYMNHHRFQSDGSLRDSDNWQKGIPPETYMKSAWRHFFEWWKYHRGLSIREGIVFSICGLLFNASGYLHETLEADEEALEEALAEAEERRELTLRRRR